MKTKGTRAERELLHLFWKSGWACMRSAGSGSTRMPSPDLIAGNQKNLFAIECKSSKGESRNLPKEEINQLVGFADIINATSFLAMRFDKEGWYFLKAKDLPKNKNGNYTISLKTSKSIGITFEQLMQGTGFEPA